ncbi:MAG: DNA polymerase III subunit gamma/tau, partial [Alphaproteobacteria bacterium]|nr:DNA polymerase III subunit gamma/tau [Alphaproteobacteria bacterium]
MTATTYRVLARRYRPTRLTELIGQDALVRTLSNAFASGRLAHAYMLSGVRGVGKTTTARIIARALNCIGEDGQGGPTASPCGRCEPCHAIAEDRHIDVLEIDAASHTGVDHMRELVDGVRYRPVSARYRVYIIDEVHMLSTQAFTALLKTLEEPPPHVKFVFATTEVRRVPLTVLSRCQRFDLRRIEVAPLAQHLSAIAATEGVAVEPPALALIARAAEGSVRDALSLLDQAIAHADGAVTEGEVRDLFGLGHLASGLDLLDRVLAGDMAAALGLLRQQYAAGSDPLAVLQDLLGLTYWLTRCKLAPEAADVALTADERRRGQEMAARLGMAALARAWQMLLKGLNEAKLAPEPLAATEMVLVRLAYASELPTPAEIVRSLGASAPAPPATPTSGSASPPPSAPP